MIYSIHPITTPNIGTHGSGSIGEPFVPGDPQNPADSDSLSPSIRPHNLSHQTTQTTGQQERPKESFKKVLSDPKSSINSTNAKTSANTAASAGPQTTGQTTALVTPMHATCADKTTAISAILPTTLTDSERARAFWAKRTDTKTFAAVSAGTQTAGHSSELVTPPYATHADETIKRSSTTSTSLKSSVNSRTLETKRIDAETCAAISAGTQTAGHSSELVTPPYDDTRTTEMLVRSIASPTTVVNYDIQSRANLFKGTRKPVAKDGNCFFAAVEKGDKQQVRESIVTWLRANPNHPFHTTTLSKYVTYETGEAWSEYCDRMQCERTWGGLPELVAASQVWRRVVRVFESVGDGLFHLRAVLGEEDFFTVPIDLVLESDHYDMLTEVRPMQTNEPETIVQSRTAEFEAIGPIATFAKWLALIPGRLEAFDISSKTEHKAPEQPVEPKTEHKAPEQPVEPKTEHKAPEKTAEPKAKCKTPEIEHKAPEQLPERKAPEQVAEPKAERKTPEQPAEPKTERKVPEQPAEFEAERKTPEQPVKPKDERKARKELVERQVLQGAYQGCQGTLDASDGNGPRAWCDQPCDRASRKPFLAVPPDIPLRYYANARPPLVRCGTRAQPLRDDWRLQIPDSDNQRHAGTSLRPPLRTDRHHSPTRLRH